MRSSAKTAGVAASAALVLVTAGCASPGADRPDPTVVVSEYLDAIAAGDAAAASDLDRAVLAADGAALPDLDVDTLRTDEVLDGAERIAAVEVDDDTTGDDDTRRVSFRYDLGGESVESSIEVVWNDDASEWELGDTLAQQLTVLAEVNAVEQALVSFEVSGTSVTQPADQAAATLSFLIYPGVYAVTADLDPALLVDPSAGPEQQVTVEPAVQPTARYAVTRLP